MIPVDGCSEHRVPCMLRCIGIGALAARPGTTLVEAQSRFASTKHS